MSYTKGQKVLVQATVLESHPDKVKVQIAKTGGIVVGHLPKKAAVTESGTVAPMQSTTAILDFVDTDPALDAG